VRVGKNPVIGLLPSTEMVTISTGHTAGTLLAPGLNGSPGTIRYVILDTIRSTHLSQKRIVQPSMPYTKCTMMMVKLRQFQ
jgi:hypothetical protein